MVNGFENVSEEKSFWISDGRTVRNIYELTEALDNIKEKTFKFHVNKNKNDFSEWIRHVLGEDELANEVAKLVMKDKIHVLLQRHVIKKMMENDNNRDIIQ